MDKIKKAVKVIGLVELIIGLLTLCGMFLDNKMVLDGPLISQYIYTVVTINIAGGALIISTFIFVKIMDILAAW